MTLKDFCEQIEENKECSISKEFMENGYMQGMVDGKIEKFSGYVLKAKNEGMVQDDTKSISQYWHLIKSYLPGYENDDAQIRYNSLKCPELLLWIAETCGVEQNKLEKASVSARKTIDESGNGHARITAASKIRGIIPWAEIEAKIQLKTL